jgi:PAS domain S-box-containing protein
MKQNETHPSDILESFFDQNLDLLCIADLKGHFLKLNPSWHSLLGYSENELIGSNFFDFIHPDDIDPTHQAMSDLQNQQSVFNFVNRYRTRFGVYKSLEWRAMAREGMIYATARDISEKISAEIALKESKLFYENIISALPDIIFIFNADAVFLYCHADTSQPLILPPDQFLGKKASEVLPPQLADLVKSGIQEALHSGGQALFEYQLPLPHQLNWFEARMLPIGNHNVICIIRNIQASKQALEQLEETGKVLKRTAEMSRVGAWEVDLKAQKAYWSDITKAIHEVPEDYVPDLPTAMDFFKEGKHRNDIHSLVDRAIREGKSYDAELILVTHLGTEKWVRVWGMPEFDRGICTRFYGTIQDIDKFKRTELELENTRIRLENLLTNMDDVVYSASLPDYRLEYLNPATFSLYGYTPEEMYLDNDIWKKVIHPEDQHIVADIYSHLSELGQVDLEYRIITRNQEVKWVRNRSKYTVWATDDTMRLEGIITDITAAKLSYYAIQEARELADKASKAKTNFVARMSHEIRTPLNGVLGFIDMLKLTHLSDDQSKYLAYASSSAISLLHIVNDILDFSKVEADMIVVELQYIPLKELMEECLQMFELLANNKNLKLTFKKEGDLPDYIYTDPIRFKQVLNNLISNAVKFTNTGEIILGFELVEKNNEGCMLRFYVKDTGIGISEKAQQNIFKPFVQADISTTRKYGGTGLGLVISQQLVEKLGGTLQLQSELNVGSTFSFNIFTLCKNQSFSIEPTAALISDSTEVTSPFIELSSLKPRILLVDDMAMNRFLLSEVILNIIPGAHIDNASDAEEAFEILEQSDLQTDLVLMDVQMPGMNGYDATRALKRSENPRICNIPVYAVTAAVMENELEACKQAGMEGVITKPLDLRQINAVLKKCLLHGTTDFSI